ncbi:hypothetical protein KTE45_28620, partial [Burkholderia multivorans]
MHIEVLVEDSSGARLLEILLPQIIGAHGAPHTWRVHPYKGIGRIPRGLTSRTDPAKRALLDQLPRLLQGYGKTPGVDAVAVVVDNDARDSQEFLRELEGLRDQCNPAPTTLFSLAIEEMEAWLLGDQNALFAAFPRAKKDVLARYKQDSICGTWELLADAILSFPRFFAFQRSRLMQPHPWSAELWSNSEGTAPAKQSRATND